MRAFVFAALVTPFLGFTQVFPNGSFESIHNITGTRDNQVRSVAAGPDGSIYVAGLTNSSDFVTTPQAARRTLTVQREFEAEVFIRKLSPDGRQIVFSTLVGPARGDGPLAMAVDATGSAYVAYRLEQGDPQPVRSLEPSGALVVVKLSPDGVRFEYRVSVLPEASYGSPIGFAVDSTGSAYIAAGDAGFGIRKLDPSGTRIEAQTKILCGDSRGLRVNTLALGPGNSVYVAGQSTCVAFPASPNAYRSSTSRPENGDAFVMRLAPNLASTVYATLLGGESVDQAFALAVEGDGSATVAGQTSRSRNLQPMAATPLGIAELKEEAQHGFVARISPDGESFKGAALLPSYSATAVTIDAKGNFLVAGAAPNSAVFAKMSPDLQTLKYIVDAPARSARLTSVFALNGRMVFGGSAAGRAFPDNDPGIPSRTVFGFISSLPEDPVKTDIRLEIQTTLATPEIYGSYTTCRFTLTNRGVNDAARLLVAANIEENANFQIWSAQPPIFNVPTFWTGYAGPVLAGVSRLGVGESATIEFHSSNVIFRAIRCFGRVYSATADTDVSDNEAAVVAAPARINVEILAPTGVLYRRDDWPVMSQPGFPFPATPNSQMRIYFPSPQKDRFGQNLRFNRWSDGVSENPRVFALGDRDVSFNAIFTNAPEGTPPTSDPGTGLPLPTQSQETPIYALPVEIPAGTLGQVIEVMGSGMREGWQVLWNGQPRPTQYMNAYQLNVTLEPEDVARPSLGWISVRDPERNVVVRAPHPLWVYLPLPNSDVVYDTKRARLWVASPAPTGTSEGQIALVDPETGTIEQTLPIAANPQTLALTDDARFLYIAAPGRIFRLNIQDRVFDQDFAIPAIRPDSLPLQASSMLAVPGRQDQLLVSLYVPFNSSSYGGTILFENGVALERRLPGNDGPAYLYGWLHDGTAIGADYRHLYHVSVENGATLKRSFEGILPGPECVLETSLLYCNSGTVFDAATGTFVRQYPARGAVGVSLGTDRVVFFDYSTQASFSRALVGPMVTVRESSAEFISASTVPIGGSPGMALGWGKEGMAYRPNSFETFRRIAQRLYLFKLP